MNISKISRSIVVAIFVAFVILLGYLNVSCMINLDETNSVSSNLIKLAYGVVLVALVLIYVYIKDKLYKMKIKRKISLIYRYIYISIIVVLTSTLAIYNIFKLLSIPLLVICITLNILISIIVKKIIFNVSKSDILSVFGMFAFSMLPNVILDKTNYMVALLVTLMISLTIFLMQITLDELKQRGIKTKKYIIYSILLGVVVAFSMLAGINALVFIIFAVVAMLITMHLDKTHISFPKKMMSSITQAKREMLYKIERININKLIIVIATVFIVTTVVYLIGFQVMNQIGRHVQNPICQTFIQNMNQSSFININIDMENSLKNIIEYGKNFVSYSKTYYMVIFIYILLMELLALLLKRRYDTKSTVMKLLFVLMFVFVAILKLNLVYFQPLFSVLLILIAIVNTSNIYLNRDERIKLLVA